MTRDEAETVGSSQGRRRLAGHVMDLMCIVGIQRAINHREL